MSEKPAVENFWAKLERSGGVKAGETFVWCIAGTSGKSRFTEELMLQHAQKHNIPLIYHDLEHTHRFREHDEMRVLKQRPRDYNGEQLTFDFNARLTDD